MFFKIIKTSEYEKLKSDLQEYKNRYGTLDDMQEKERIEKIAKDIEAIQNFSLENVKRAIKGE